MKSGCVYNTTKVLREYIDETEAERGLGRLKAGKITEEELVSARHR
jgi:hypothetical protein